MLEYPVQKVRVNIGSTTSSWDGIDSVQCMFAPVSMCLPQTVVKPPFVNTSIL
jgi:hypothetical protein